jgi:TatD DNase family protein
LAFFDSHAHLADSAFDADRDAVVQAAVDAGAAGIVCIGESQEAAEGGRALAERHRRLVYFTAGVHPHNAAEYETKRDREWMGESIAAGAVAVGECGLDYHYDNSPRDRQRAAFLDQLALAAEVSRPVVVHTRDAEADTIGALRDAARANVRGVLHCFTGSPALAEAAVEAGWMISFSGIITFAKWSGDDIVRGIPEDRLLVETDSPYLAPVPVRGRRNEPRYIPHVLARLAIVRGVAVDLLASRLVSNTQRFFGLATAPGS